MLQEKQKEVRKIFPLKLSQKERMKLKQAALASGMNLTQFIKTAALEKAGQMKPSNKMLAGRIPEINWQTYNQLCEIAQRIERLENQKNDSGVDNNSPGRAQMPPKEHLAAELLQLIQQVGYRLIGKSAK